MLKWILNAQILGLIAHNMKVIAQNHGSSMTIKNFAKKLVMSAQKWFVNQ